MPSMFGNFQEFLYFSMLSSLLSQYFLKLSAKNSNSKTVMKTINRKKINQELNFIDNRVNAFSVKKTYITGSVSVNWREIPIIRSKKNRSGVKPI